MFDKLQIRRFRHNEKLDVNLQPITVFRGPSGSGKSSLMGALRWVAFNSPPGKGFIHWGCVSSAVKLTEGNTSYIRKKGKTENYYQLNKQKFKAFGTGVPEKVALGLSLSSINFQRQHASPFWFSETAGEVNRQLNKIINLDLVDITLSNLDKEARKTTHKIEDIKTRIKKAKQQKKKLRPILSLNKRLKKVEKMSEKHAEKVKRIEFLNAWISEAKEYKGIINKPIPNVTNLVKLQGKYKRMSSQYNILMDLVHEANNYQEDIKEYKIGIKKSEKKLKRVLGKVCPLCGSQLKTKI